MAAISCCKNCPKQGCGPYHDVCEEYQAAKAALAEDKLKLRQEFQADRYLRDSAAKPYQKKQTCERQIKFRKGI